VRDAFTDANGHSYSNCGDFGDAYSNRNSYGNSYGDVHAYTHEPAEG
jgi:hypothetical protein